MSPRKSLLFLFVIAAMAFGAVGASVASAHGVTSHASANVAAKFKATKTLSYRKTAKPKLSVKVSDKVKGGREITRVKVTLPKGFTYKKSALKKHLVVKNHKFTRTANGRVLTVKLKKATKTVTITVKRGGIKVSQKARAARASKGKVRLTITEKKAATTKPTPVTSTNELTKLLTQTSTNLTTIENAALNTELTDLETALAGGASTSSLDGLPIIGQLLTTLSGNTATAGLATELTTGLSSLTGSDLSSFEGLAALDDGLTSGIATLSGNLTKLQTELVAAGVPKSLLAPVVTLVKKLGTGLPATVSQLAAALTTADPSDPTAALAALQQALETNHSMYQSDLTTAIGSLVSGLTTLSSSSSSNALTSAITQLTSALNLSDSSSGVLGTGLSGLVSTLGLNLGGLLSDLGLGSTGLGDLGSLLSL